MEMRHELIGSNHKVDNLVREQIGFNRRNTETFDALQTIQVFDQCEEICVVQGAVITDVHSGENNFFGTGINCFLSLRNGLFDCCASASSASQRNRTECTEIIASILNFQECARAVTGREGGNEVLYIFYFSNMNSRCRHQLLLVHMIHQIELLSGSQHQINAGYGRNLLGFQLSVAPNHSHKNIGIRSDCTAYDIAALLVGLFGNAACVNHKNIGSILHFYSRIARFFELAGQCRCFGKIQFTTQGMKGNASCC